MITRGGLGRIEADNERFKRQNMNAPEVLKYLDEVVFAQTGKHLDSLQEAIIKGVLNGRKYADIAKEYNCSTGHAKDEAYELWQILSKALGEELNKSNFRASVERLKFSNYQYKNRIFGHSIVGSNINFCPKPSQVEEQYELENLESIIKENITPAKVKPSNIDSLKIAKKETILRLVKVGLTTEQIAQVLDLPLDEVQESM